MRRKEYKKGKLSKARIEALEAVEGWLWDPIEANFQEGLSILKAYVKRAFQEIFGNYEKVKQGRTHSVARALKV